MTGKPTHPGEVFLKDVLEPLGITVTDAAAMLGVTRKTLSEFVNEKSALSPEMAIRIAKATTTTPESWMAMQMKLTLWLAMQNAPKNVKAACFGSRVKFGTMKSIWRQKPCMPKASRTVLCDFFAVCYTMSDKKAYPYKRRAGFLFFIH